MNNNNASYTQFVIYIITSEFESASTNKALNRGCHTLLKYEKSNNNIPEPLRTSILHLRKSAGQMGLLGLRQIHILGGLLVGGRK